MVENLRKTAFLFPGQGSQYTGMGKDFYEHFKEAREVFDQANEILGFDLAELCFNGKQEKLNKTSVCQPAILVTSIAILEILKKNYSNWIDTCHAAAGLSLGEYTAHVSAGS
ncbi:MAG TPA: ACP S-malonyltransferase, partial [Candidatus Brocadiaceae bacterium]